jgi:colicin import membrane protein
VSPAQAALALAASVGLLTGCAADPGAERREQVAALTEAANAGDAGRVRDRADALLEILDQQAQRQELPKEEADRLRVLTREVRSGADLLDEDLLERRRAEAEMEAERQRLDAERQRLEEDRRQAEQERQRLEEERREAEQEAEQRQEEEEQDADKPDKPGKADNKDGKGKKDDEDG